MFNLLAEDLIQANDEGFKVSLPKLLSAWSMEETLTLRGLRKHQRAAIHQFLVQTAVMALQRSGVHKLQGETSSIWHDRLLLLASQSAWDLIVEDKNLPAFMQAPLPDDKILEKDWDFYPDNFSTLFSGKNHSVKQSIIKSSNPWDWIVSLIELQTQTPRSGPGNYGIMRMNGSAGARCLVSLYPDLEPSARWRRDVNALLERNQFEDFSTKSTCLLWTLPWDGVEMLSLEEVHPYCIEVARRIRLGWENGKICARSTTSQSLRINARDRRGVVNDPWTPLVVEGEQIKSLSLSSAGWSIGKLKNLIFTSSQTDHSIVPSPLQSRRECEREQPLYLYAAAFAGGVGKTEGYHEATVRIPASAVRSIFWEPEERDRLAETANLMLEDADYIRMALKFSVKHFMRLGTDDQSAVDRTGMLAKRFESDYQINYFPTLWKSMAGNFDRYENWIKVLSKSAEEVLNEVMQSIPTHAENKLQAQTVAKNCYWRMINKKFSSIGKQAKEA